MSLHESVLQIYSYIILCAQIYAYFCATWIKAIMCMWIMIATELDYSFFPCTRSVWCCQCCHGSWFWRWLMTWVTWKMRICSINFTASTFTAMRTSGNSNRPPCQLKQQILLDCSSLSCVLTHTPSLNPAQNSMHITHVCDEHYNSLY